MRTKILATMAIVMFAMATSFATSPEVTLRTEITSQINFPKVFADLQIEGTVFAEFTVNEDGKIEVLNCNSL